MSLGTWLDADKFSQDLLRKRIHREYYDQHEGSFAGAPPRVVEGHLGNPPQIPLQNIASVPQACYSS